VEAPASTTARPRIEVRTVGNLVDATVEWFSRGKEDQGVDRRSFAIEPARVGLVGESCSGKTTVGAHDLRSSTPTAGRHSVPRHRHAISRKARCGVRARETIFQGPLFVSSSLNHAPCMVEGSWREPLVVHGIGRKRGAPPERGGVLLGSIGLHPDPADASPHELSRRQRQRIARRALAAARNSSWRTSRSRRASSRSKEHVGICARPERRSALTMMCIAPDIAVGRDISDRIIVMYLRGAS